MPAGRPEEYKEEYCQQILDYFSIEPNKIILERFYYKNGDEKEKEVEVANDLPTIEGFCRKLGISKQTLHNWTKKHEEFMDAYKRAREIQEDIWVVNAMKGLYAQPFAIFAGKNMFGWRDKRETDVTSGGERIKVIVPQEIAAKNDIDPSAKTDSQGQA